MPLTPWDIKQAVEEAGPVLHPPQPGLHQRSQLLGASWLKVRQLAGGPGSASGSRLNSQ